MPETLDAPQLPQGALDDYVQSETVSNIVTLTQAEYDAIGSPDPETLYIIEE